MPRPGSHKYDRDRARLRKRRYEKQGIPDAEAGKRANKVLQRDKQRRPVPRTARAQGPKGER